MRRPLAPTQNLQRRPEMDPMKQPGIRFTGVELLGMSFAVNGEVSGTIPTGLYLGIDRKVSEDGQTLDVVVQVDLFKNISPEKRPPIDLKFALRGHFVLAEEPNMTWDVFAKDHAPAHLIPYVRELISNITSRSPLPTLNMGPVNVKAMVAKGTAEFLFAPSPKPTQQME